MSERIRVLHLVTKWGRPTDMINDYIRHLDGDDFDSCLCSFGPAPEETFHPEGYSLRFLGYGKSDIKGFGLKIPMELKRLILEKDVEILHCHKFKSILYGTLAAAMSGKKDLKVIACIGSLRRSRTLNRRIRNRLIFRKLSRIIAVSDGVRQDVLKDNRFLEPAKVVVIHNGIDLKRFPLRNGSDPKEAWPVLGTAGRLVQTKGQIYLLRAFAEVVKKYPGALLLFAGAGPLLNDLKEASEDLGVASRVRFLGFQKDVSHFLNTLDLFVFPSVAEGFGLSLVEAMATGVPVVASRVGGIPEILEGQPCGRLVEAGDVEGLTQAILDLLSRGEQGLHDMGLSGRQRVEEAFSVDRMAENIGDLYRQVTAEI